MDNRTIAYICAEYAIDSSLPTYAGGLGVLAGDIFLEAADHGLDFNLISLSYGAASGLTLLPDKIICPLGRERVPLRIWTKKINRANLYLLDGGNITKTLYGPDDLVMLKQQILLGFGSLSLLKYLGIKPSIYHLNEGHTAMVALALACEFAKEHSGATTLTTAIANVKQNIVATKHTILPIAGLHIPWELVRIQLGPIINDYGLQFSDLAAIATHIKNPEFFSTTQLLLNSAIRSSAVSELHAKFEKEIHPSSTLIPISNGVNQNRWQKKSGKMENKQELANYLIGSFNIQINPQALTIIWARRLAAYKRPHLLFSNPTRLEQIVNLPNRPVQIIIAGRVNPGDFEAAKVVMEIAEHCQGPNLVGKVFFIPRYDLDFAQKLTGAADVWLNTPLPGKEASGTSGMKAALNKALQFSTADGWMAEQDWSKTGWILFEDNIADNLYDIIEKKIVPLYYEGREEWDYRARKTQEIVEKQYTAARVLKDYCERLYWP